MEILYFVKAQVYHGYDHGNKIQHGNNRCVAQQDYDTLAEGQWLNDTIIEFHIEYLEREVIPQDAKILLLRPATVHLISHIQGVRMLNRLLKMP
jgi:sentrin-specific protease 8